MRPKAPVVGVGGVVVREGRVLLIQRGKPPLVDRWVIPGGTVELGETLLAALVREMEEETALRVEPTELLTAFDHVERDSHGVACHFVILDYLCRWLSGEARAGSDAREVAWAGAAELAAYDLPPKVLEVVEDALRRSAAGDRPLATRGRHSLSSRTRIPE